MATKKATKAAPAKKAATAKKSTPAKKSTLKNAITKPVVPFS
ncbi:hypothetical protein [Ferruginibacter sp.]|nr:hypothetical protein [Ferruginibacter sp.]